MEYREKGEDKINQFARHVLRYLYRDAWAGTPKGHGAGTLIQAFHVFNVGKYVAT